MGWGPPGPSFPSFASPHPSSHPHDRGPEASLHQTGIPGKATTGSRNAASPAGVHSTSCRGQASRSGPFGDHLRFQENCKTFEE